MCRNPFQISEKIKHRSDLLLREGKEESFKYSGLLEEVKEQAWFRCHSWGSEHLGNMNIGPLYPHLGFIHMDDGLWYE